MSQFPHIRWYFLKASYFEYHVLTFCKSKTINRSEINESKWCSIKLVSSKTFDICERSFRHHVFVKEMKCQMSERAIREMLLRIIVYKSSTLKHQYIWQHRIYIHICKSNWTSCVNIDSKCLNISLIFSTFIIILIGLY